MTSVSTLKRVPSTFCVCASRTESHAQTPVTAPSADPALPRRCRTSHTRRREQRPVTPLGARLLNRPLGKRIVDQPSVSVASARNVPVTALRGVVASACNFVAGAALHHRGVGGSAPLMGVTNLMARRERRDRTRSPEMCGALVTDVSDVRRAQRFTCNSSIVRQLPPTHLR